MQSLADWRLNEAKRAEETHRFEEKVALMSALLEAGDRSAARSVLLELAREKSVTCEGNLPMALMYIIRSFNLRSRRFEAEFALRTALTLAREEEAAATTTLMVAEQLRGHLLGEKRWGEAADMQEEIVNLVEVAYGEPATSRALKYLEDLSSHVPDLDPEVAARRRDLTVAALARALSWSENVFGTEHPMTGDTHLRLGFALAKAGRREDAVRHLTRGLSVCGDETKEDTAAATRLLAQSDA